jgi:DNA-binding SARP family transcriptional activator
MDHSALKITRSRKRPTRTTTDSDGSESLSALSFGILGLTQISVDGEERLISATRQREVLAILLLRASRVVAKDELVERLWPDEQPPGVQNALHTHVRRLRKNLGHEAAARIVTRYPGYLMSVEPEELDLDVFETLRTAAERAARARDWREAYGASTAALAQWRGEPLLDVPRLHRRDEEVLRLEEARLQVTEVRMQALVELGSYAVAVGELQELVRGHPLRERFAELYMTTLARDGRRAEALTVYLDTRRALVGGLGIEPGPALRELHREILEGAVPAH